MATKTEKTEVIEEKKVAPKEAPKPSGKVKIKLFKDNDKYKDDVFVGVNGKAYKIQRGVEVEVPRFVAEVLRLSLKQDEHTADLIAIESSLEATENRNK